MAANRPIVLCFSGHDPCGGAGVQADIEVLISHQCHAASVISTLTVQDSHNVKALLPQHPEQFRQQAQCVLADLPVKVIKIGLIGDAAIALEIHQLLLAHPHIPVVLDPILAAGGGSNLASEALIHLIFDRLVPLAKVMTPNSREALRLTGCSSLNDAGEALVAQGCPYVLISGGDDDSSAVHNRLYQLDQAVEVFTWERLPGNFHGSGCTLATSIAALLAQGLDPFMAINEAQDYTWNALNTAYATGSGQLNPHRLFWAEA